MLNYNSVLTRQRTREVIMPKPIYATTRFIIKWVIVATIVGVAGGSAAYLLYMSIQFFSNVRTAAINVFVAPALAGLLVGILLYPIEPKVSSYGTNIFLHAVNQENGDIRGRTSLIKLISSSLTLGFGGSGGVEGPMVLIGGSISSFLFRFRIFSRFLTQEDRRIATICGAAGAIGAIFRSPVGGGIFVVELLYKSSLHYTELFPAVISSSMGYTVMLLLTETEPLFYSPVFQPQLQNIPYFLFAAIVAGAVSLIFRLLFQRAFHAFNKLNINPMLKPALGGIMTGLTAYVFGIQVLGIGIEHIQNFILGSASLQLLLLLLVGKMLATIFTISSGGSAGLVIPALYVGAVTGSIFSILLGFSGLTPHYSLVVVGMSASLSVMANVPLAAVIMIVEMLGLKMGIPAVIGAIIGFVVGRSKEFYEITHEEHNNEVCQAFKNLDRELDH